MASSSTLRCIVAAAVVGLGLPHHLSAISVDYISTKIRDSADCAGIIGILKNDIDKKMSGFPLISLTRENKDSLVPALQKAYVSLQKCGKRGPSLKVELLSGVVLLYLEQLGFPGSYAGVQSLLKKALMRFPKNEELAWIRGLHLISSGDAFEGIRTLDSLRVSGFSEEEFLGDYARYVFYSFIPLKNDTFRLVLQNASALQPSDTATPASFSWKIIRSQRAPLPFFDYEAAFAIRKPFKLVFSGVPGSNASGMLRYHAIEPQSAESADLTRQLSDRIDSARCTVHIDVNDIKISPYEYLVKRISGIYDSIEVRGDLPRYKALSLRCYNRGLWGREGSSTAYIVFDRTYIDLFAMHHAKKNLRREVGEKKIRFTVTMRCGSDVEDQAEAKLQSILRAF